MTYAIASVFPAPPPDPAPVRVLAFDQSTHCGWAIIGPDMPRPLWGVIELVVDKNEDETPMWSTLRGLIERAVGEHGITHVFFEQPLMPSINMPATIYGQRQWMMVAVIQDNTNRLLNRSAEQVPTATWRKQFIGAGAAPRFDAEKGRKLETPTQKRAWWKRSAIAACMDRGWLVDNDNAAEAIGIACFGLSCVSPAFAARQGPLFRRAEMTLERQP